MGWLDRLRGREPKDVTEIATLRAEVTRLKEAIPGGYDPDLALSATGGGSPYFRRLSQSQRDLDLIQLDKAQSMSYWLWENNPYAHRIINLTVDYVLGEGVTIEAEHDDEGIKDAMQKCIDTFWQDSVNRLDIKLWDKVRELAIYGEQCWPVFTNASDGFIRLGYLDPSQIVAVLTDPRNAEVAQAVKVRQGPGRPDLYSRVIHVDERPESAAYGRMVGADGPDGVGELIYDTTQSGSAFAPVQATAVEFAGSCFYFAVNKVSNASRGRPDLLCLVDWIDGYDQFLMQEMDRWILQKAFVWDVELAGMTDAQIAEYARAQAPPNPGSVFYHNDRLKRQAITPDLKAVDAAAGSDLLTGYIATGSGLPKTWLSATEDSNRATAAELGEPAFKSLSARQRTVKYLVEYMLTFVLDQAELAGRLPKRPNVPGTRKPMDWPVQVQLPEIRPRDLAALSNTFNITMDAVIKARSERLLDEESAQQLTVMAAGLMGVEIDIARMRERLEDEAQEDEAAALAPYPANGPQEPPDGQERPEGDMEVSGTMNRQNGASAR
jgi:hypothetical protein